MSIEENKEIKTALILASNNDHQEVIILLIKRGVLYIHLFLLEDSLVLLKRLDSSKKVDFFTTIFKTKIIEIHKSIIQQKYIN